jgi:hypothetical protein
MAKQTTTTTTNPEPHHTMDVKGKSRTLPLLGPFGDKALYGSKLEYGYGKADMEKANLDNPPRLSEWFFCAWVPANDAETKALVNAKTDMARDLIVTALLNKARAQSWAENRGGAVTADVKVTLNGKTTVHKRVALGFIDTLRDAGATVEVLPREKRTRKAK